MKNAALLLTLLVATAGAKATDVAENTNLTLAVADIKAKTVWVETEEDVQLRLSEDLEEKADTINAKINAKLEQQLEAKLAKDLGI